MIDEAAGRLAVVAETREWIGTPYRHGGRIKGQAADCTFFAVVFEAVGVIPHVEIAPYAPQAHLNREGSIYQETIEKYAHEVTSPKPGDVVLFWFGRAFSHGGVIVETGWPSIIHGDMAAGFVVEASGAQGKLANAKARKFFSFW